jgi:hypothetical protein
LFDFFWVQQANGFRKRTLGWLKRFQVNIINEWSEKQHQAKRHQHLSDLDVSLTD